MKKITLLLFAFLFQISFAQNVFKAQKEIYLAQYYSADKNDKESLKHYLKAFELNPKAVSNNYLKASSIAFSLKKNKAAKKLLIESIIQEEAPLDFIKGFKELQPFKNTKEFKEIISKYDFYRDEYYRNLKHPFAYFKIKELIAKDQLVRNENVAFTKTMDKIDSANITELINLTEKYGWEKRAWLLLWHHRGSNGDENFVWKYFTPVLKDEIKNGTLNKDFFVDFEEINNCNKTGMISTEAIYKLGSAGNCGIKYFDIKNLDLRRKTVGLPPLYFDYFINNNTSSLPESYEYNKENLLKDLENL